MKPRRESVKPPSTIELAAYADGELSAVDRKRVEAWLSSHPEAVAEVKAHKRLHRLWRAGAPPEPSETEWAAVLDNVEREASRKRAGSLGDETRGRRERLAVAMLAAAAAVLLALTMSYQRSAHNATEPNPVEPFPVASAEDVEIISVEADDIAALVVGDMPLRRPIVLAAPGDVTLKSMERDADGEFPDVRMQPDGEETPMIFAPLAVVKDN